MTKMRQRVVVGVTTEEVRITPKLAAEWLRTNQGNRKIRKMTVDAYARDMRAGKWKVTHQGIAFDERGHLLDGQHRLAAVILADTPVTMLVVRGVARENLQVVDAGVHRTAADNGKILYGLCNVNERYAAARGILMLDHDDAHGTKYTRPEQDQAVAENEEGISFMISRSPHLRPVGSFGAAFAYAYPVAKPQVHAFVDSLISFADIKEKSPILAVRAARYRTPPVGVDRFNLMLKVLRCLEAYCKGESLERALAHDSGLKYFQKLRHETEWADHLAPAELFRQAS